MVGYVFNAFSVWSLKCTQFLYIHTHFSLDLPLLRFHQSVESIQVAQSSSYLPDTNLPLHLLFYNTHFPCLVMSSYAPVESVAGRAGAGWRLPGTSSALGRADLVGGQAAT